jgi:hypothetical protein
MRLGGKCDPSAHTHARRVIHSLEPSWMAALTSFLSYIFLVKTRFERPVILIKNPFSSMLYV